MEKIIEMDGVVRTFDGAAVQEYSSPAGAFRVRVELDPDGECPRGEGLVHSGAMYLPETRGYVGVKDEDYGTTSHWDLEDAVQDHEFQTVARWLRIFHGATAVLPIGRDGYDGRVSPGLETDQMDRERYGVIFDTPALRREGWGEEEPPRETIVANLAAEINDYGTWAAGEMTGYVVERMTVERDDDRCDGRCTYGCGTEDNDGEWEEVESCWGYYSDDEALEQGVEALEPVLADAVAKHVEALAAAASDEAEVADLAAVEMGAAL